MGPGFCNRCGYSKDGHWVNLDRCPEYVEPSGDPGRLMDRHGDRMLSPGIPAHDVERAAAGLCRNCGRPAVEYVVDARGFPPAQCWVGKTEYSCHKPLFDDVEDRRPPAPAVG